MLTFSILHFLESSKQGESQVRGAEKYFLFTVFALVIPMLVCIGFLLKSKICKNTFFKCTYTKMFNVETEKWIK